ncbi:hypothetical protein D3C85_1090150 [compost metagenome]
MVMVGSGNRDSIEVFMLLIQHFAPVFIVFGFWESLNTVGSAAIVYITKKSDICFSAFVEHI